MNDNIISSITKFIWLGGTLFFLIMSLPNLWGTLVFLFDCFNGLFLDIEPSAENKVKAKETGLMLFSTMVLCIAFQLVVFATPFVLMQSANLVQYYTDREKEYVKALSGRLDLAKSLTEAEQQIKAVNSDAYQCRQQVQLLRQECAALAKEVTLARNSLSEQISKTSKLNDKGDF